MRKKRTTNSNRCDVPQLKTGVRKGFVFIKGERRTFTAIYVHISTKASTYEKKIIFKDERPFTFALDCSIRVFEFASSFERGLGISWEVFENDGSRHCHRKVCGGVFISKGCVWWLWC